MMASHALALRRLNWRALCRFQSSWRCVSTTGIPVDGVAESASELNLPDPLNPFENPLASLGDEEMSDDQYYWRSRAASSPPVQYKRIVDHEGRSFAIGKRKRSVARVWLRKGGGGITVNGKNYVDVFPRVDQRDQILRPFLATGNMGKFAVDTTIWGGGNTGQAEALRHGIAKALQLYDPGLRPPLKKDGLLTRDSRVVESKKYGLKYVTLSSNRGFYVCQGRIILTDSLILCVSRQQQESTKGSYLGQAVVL